MLRRCIFLFLIGGLFVSPMATIPHAHAGMSDSEQQEHDATPHIHSHPHGHHDHGAGNSGHHHLGLDERPQSENESKPAGIYGERKHHDDAIFICVQPFALELKSKVEQNTPQSPFASLVTIIESRIAAWPPPRIEPPWQTPDAIKDGSEIYLTLRNLRI